MSYDNVVNVLRKYQDVIKNKDEHIQELIEEISILSERLRSYEANDE